MYVIEFLVILELHVIPFFSSSSNLFNILIVTHYIVFMYYLYDIYWIWNCFKFSPSGHLLSIVYNYTFLMFSIFIIFSLELSNILPSFIIFAFLHIFYTFLLIFFHPLIVSLRSMLFPSFNFFLIPSNCLLSNFVVFLFLFFGYLLSSSSTTINFLNFFTVFLCFSILYLTCFSPSYNLLAFISFFSLSSSYLLFL